MAFELAHDLDKDTWGGNYVMKLDLAKSYDKVDLGVLVKGTGEKRFMQSLV